MHETDHIVEGKRTHRRLIDAGVLMSLVLAGSLVGCTGSVYPLLTEKELLEDSDLTGDWILETRDKDNNLQKVPVRLDSYDTSTYDLELPPEMFGISKKQKTPLQTWPDAWTFQIGKIDGQLYGQLIPRDAPLGPVVAAGVPVYWFGKVSLLNNVLEFTPVRDDWAAVAKKMKLPHVTYEPSTMVEMTVFTMQTAELQNAVRKHGHLLFRSRALVLRKSNSAAD